MEKMEVKRNDNSSIAVPLIVALIGIMILCGGIFLQVRQYNINKKTVEVKAVIHSARASHSGSGNKSRGTSYTVDYSYDGRNFRDVSLAIEGNNHEVGDIVNIRVNPDNPSESYSDFGGKAGKIIIVFGAIFSLFGLFGVSSVIKQKREDEYKIDMSM